MKVSFLKTLSTDLHFPVVDDRYVTPGGKLASHCVLRRRALQQLRGPDCPQFGRPSAYNVSKIELPVSPPIEINCLYLVTLPLSQRSLFTCPSEKILLILPSTVLPLEPLSPMLCLLPSPATASALAQTPGSSFLPIWLSGHEILGFLLQPKSSLETTIRESFHTNEQSYVAPQSTSAGNQKSLGYHASKQSPAPPSFSSLGVLHLPLVRNYFPVSTSLHSLASGPLQLCS